MTQKRKDLPQPSASNFQQRLREALQTYMGRQGDPLDRGITLRDLLNTGLAKLRDGATLGPGSSTPPIAPIPVDIPVYEADLTPPPQPDGFAVSAAISHVFIEHNPPTYTQGHGHLRTRVYGAIVTPALPMPVFTDAVEVSQFSGTIHAHPSNPATTWRLWIKWESADGVLSATPAGGTNGLLATTGEDVSQLLDALAGSITSTELASSLATPIASINQPTTGIVARLNAQSSLIGSLQTEVAALSGTPDYAAGTTYAADDIVQYSGGLYRAIATTTGNLPTNTAYWQKIGDYASLGDAVAAHAVRLDDHQTRITATETGLVAEASARTVLASTVDANAAAIGSEASTRASADSALSTTINTVSAVANSKIKTYNQTSAPTSGMTAGDLWFDSDASNRVYRYSGSAWVETTDPRIASTAAAVTTETAARVAGDAALASQITTLSGTVSGNTAAISTEATTRADADSALSTQVSTLSSSLSTTNTNVAAAQTAASNAAALAGSKGKVLVQSTTPEAVDRLAQNLWIDTTSNTNTPKRWSGSAWVAVTDKVATDAAAAAAAAQATANTKADATALAATNTSVSNLNGVVTAQGTSITNLTATVSGNNTAQTAAVQTEATTRANADSALTNQVTTLFAQFRNGPVLPDDFRNGLADWTGARAGDPALVATVSGTAIDNDADFGRCLEISYWDAAGENILTKGVVTVAPGKVFRVTSRFKVVTLPPDGSFSLNSVIPHLSDTYGNSSTTFTNPLTINATGIYEITDTISNVAPVGGWAWAAGTKHLRAGLRMNSAETTGLVLRIQSIKFVEVTAEQALTAAIQSEATTRANADSALSTQVTTLTATVNSNNTAQSAAVSAEATARVNADGSLFAQYTVKTDVAGLVSGYGLASTATNAAPTSSFGVRASNFFVAPPSVAQATAPTVNLYKGFVWLDTSVTPNVTRYWTGSAWVTTPQTLPFVVQTTPQVINGFTVEPGIYGESAFFARLVATRGQIGILAVDDARIASVAVGKLVAGSIAVGEYIQGTGYVPGSSGWRINGDGTAEFSGVVVRGTVFASAGLIGGSTIGSTYIRSNTYVLNESGWNFNSDGTGQVGGIAFLTDAMQSSNYVAETAGWRLTRAGVFEASSGTFRGALSAATGTFAGSLSAATGTFSGSLSAATGTFSGTLTASAINAVNTINLAGQAVTIPSSSYVAGAVTVGNVETALASVSFTSSGAPVFVFFNCAADYPSFDINHAYRHSLRLYRNGVLLRTQSAVNVDGSNPSSGTPLSSLPTIAIVDTPGQGTVTYEVRAINANVSNGNVRFTARSMLCLETKR